MTFEAQSRTSLNDDPNSRSLSYCKPSWMPFFYSWHNTWQDFTWLWASRGPSATPALLVKDLWAPLALHTRVRNWRHRIHDLLWPICAFGHITKCEKSEKCCMEYRWQFMHFTVQTCRLYSKRGKRIYDHAVWDRCLALWTDRKTIRYSL